MEHSLGHDGAKSDEHDHETLEIFIEVPGVNVTESKAFIEVT